jgi:cytochrome P450
MRVLLIAGHETTAASLGYSLRHLAEHPDDRRRLNAEPALVSARGRGTAPALVARDPAGAERDARGRAARGADRRGRCRRVDVRVCEPRPDALAHAERCLLDREPNRHGAFGFGPHVCAGAHVARLELMVTLKEVGARASELRLDGPSRWNPTGSVRSLASLPVVIG